MHISMNRVRAASAQKGSDEPPSAGMRAAAAAVNSLCVRQSLKIDQAGQRGPSG
jgi:hypothetical protein